MLTPQQVETLAPDAQVLAAGRTLAKPGHWRATGRSAAALWGECLGSALYQVRVDLSDFGSRCSCPSRKHPCKHVIGLLMLALREPPAEAEAPDWVTGWVTKRHSTETHPAQPAESARTGSSGTQSRRRAEARQRRILEGMDMLERWMCDIVRNGMAGIELQPPSFWDQQAARLVDAQAPGLAARVRRLSGIPRSGPGWPQRLLGEMGKLELLLHAYRRLDGLDPLLQHDVRQLVGLRLSTEEVAEQGEHLIDDWSMVGQWVEQEGPLRTQRSWLVGLNSHRTALILEFAAGRQASFPYVSAINAVQRMELQFWPGAYPQRARIARRLGEPYRLDERRPGHATVEAFLAVVSAALARNPWLDRFVAVLHDVVPVVGDGEVWSIRDRNGVGIPLLERGYWRSMANSGGHPMDLYGEWDGHALRPTAFRVLEDIPRAEAG
jgi:hypothetical protein